VRGMEEKHTITRGMEESKKYWLVVYSNETGDFKNASMLAQPDDNSETVSKKFEQKYPGYRVIHIGEGELPPKTYRSLQYIN
jgi:hypothetical protein